MGRHCCLFQPRHPRHSSLGICFAALNLIFLFSISHLIYAIKVVLRHRRVDTEPTNESDKTREASVPTDNRNAWTQAAAFRVATL